MEKVGLVGLGIMGKPMALNLLKAGYELIVNDVVQGPVDEVAAAGAEVAGSPREVAENCAVIITMLPDSPEVEEVAFGEGGLIGGLSEGQLYIDMSTIAPATAKKVYEAFGEKGVEALDAPVSGGEIGAIEGTMTIMVGGTEAAFDRAQPIFEILGGSMTLIGPPGAGQVCKVCNQIVVGVTIQAVAEALTLARKAGVDPGKVRQALLGGFAQSRILDLHGQRNLDRNFKPGFKIKLHRKDLGIALQTSRELNLPLITTSQVATLMDAMIGLGMEETDHSGLALMVEKMAGMEID